mmetsp:Transcript_31909/g.32337  ORF Transcript_31909/g.32337 Transcript_31909/m.32337 type:complete len:80 (-) Transcript_31909:5-244(-)
MLPQFSMIKLSSRTFCLQNDHLRFSKGCGSHHKQLHGQQSNASIFFELQSISQTNMTSDSDRCFGSFNWKIHTLLYMTH